MTVRVVVVGSANMDLVATTAALPGPGQTVLGQGFTTAPGGKGANQALAAARAGADCTFIGAVGDDAFGAELRAGLHAGGVRTSLTRTVPGPSGVALIAVDDAGENQIVVAPGANAGLTDLRPDELATIGSADVLMAQLEIPAETVAAAARAARAEGVTVMLNAAPARQLPAELLSAIDVLLVNEGEARTVANRSDDPRDVVIDVLLELVPRVVLTLGARGASYGDRNGARLTMPAPVVSAVDTTAAGDAFAGAFAVAWAEGRPVTDALRWACAAGAACARTLGAATALPTREQIDELYEAAA